MNGDDKNDGLTPETPVRSIARLEMLKEEATRSTLWSGKPLTKCSPTEGTERTGQFPHLEENLVDGLPPWTVKI